MSEPTRISNDPDKDIAPLFSDLDYGVTLEETEKLSSRYDDLTEITDRKTYDEVGKGIATLRKARMSIDERRKELGHDALEFKRKVDADGKELIAALTPQENRLKALKETVDAVKRTEREAREAAERDRIAGIHALMDAMRQLPTKHMRSPSAVVESAMDELRDREMTEETYQEFLERALEVRGEVLVELEELRDGALHDERLAEKQKREADELTKQKAEFKEQQRKAAEAEKDRREADEKDLAAELAKVQEERQKLQDERDAKVKEEAAVEEKERQAKAEKEAKARSKRLAPDKDKLLEFAGSLAEITQPEVQSKEAKQILAGAITSLDALRETVIESVSTFK